MLEHMIERISKATIVKEPFSRFFIEEVFPQDFYQEMMDHFPEKHHFQSLSLGGGVPSGSYLQRVCFPLDSESLCRLPLSHLMIWTRVATSLKSTAFLSMILALFQSEFSERFGDQKMEFQPSLELVSDFSDHSIGPHTDLPQKILTLLFYLPRNDQQRQLGTAIYKPKDPSFRCAGLIHHSSKGFQKIDSAPFLPNSVFGFFKSDRSFHGVEPIGTQKSPRNLMSYQLLLMQPK